MLTFLAHPEYLYTPTFDDKLQTPNTMKKHLLLLLAALLTSLGTSAQTFADKQKHQPPQDIGRPYQVIRGANAFQQGLNPTVSAQYPGIRGSLRQRLAQQLPEARSHRIAALDGAGLPIFIRSEADDAFKKGPSSLIEAQQLASRYLEELKSLTRVVSPAQEFVPGKKLEDAEAYHLRFQQQYLGVPIYGAEVVVHLRKDGERLFNGHYRATPAEVSTVPGLSEQDAITAAIRDVSQITHYRPLRNLEKKILKYPGHQAELVLYAPPSQPEALHLAYHLSFRPNFVERWEYFVDAHNGAILHKFDHTCSFGPKGGSSSDLNGVSRSFRIYEDNNGLNYLIDGEKFMYKRNHSQFPDLGDGIIVTADLQNTSTSNPSYSYITSNNANSWSPVAVSAHYNAGISYEYFRTHHSRNSINGTGGDVVSFVNVADDNGQGLDNAFWNGQAIFYGNGQNAFRPLAGALDVAGHEMSHGVIQETANLEYQDESGALNESFADIFGVMIDDRNWQLGEEVVRTNYFPSGALRDMSDPHNGGSSLNDPGYQPKKYSERYTGSQDNGGVHINSGIPNHAFYLFAQSVGNASAERIYYNALTRYLTRTSNFLDCRLAVIQAAVDSFGSNSAQSNAAANAFDQVEIFDPSGGGGGGGGGPTPNLQDLPVNPGPDYIVSTDVNPADINTLYLSSTQGSNFQPLSTTRHKRKISIRDDGAWGYFVGTDDHIREIAINPNNPQEGIISSSAVWNNVAISKDGRKLAAITTSIDTSIYVFDLLTGRGFRFFLYNPTFTQGVNAAGVLHADALEWDYSGEYLMYDAFNRLEGTLGSADIEYWDVGILHVWDNNTNDWGSGEVTKLFTQLDPGISIGNAVFSSNSPYIISFDYLDANTNGYAVLSANIETGDVQLVYTNDQLGFPNYSKLDDKVIFSRSGFFGTSYVATINVGSDKITPTGTASDIIPDGTWGVWFAQGTRDLMLNNDPDLGAGLEARAFPNPFTDQLTLQYELESAASVAVLLYDMQGKVVKRIKHGLPQGPGQHRLTADLSKLTAGTYVLRLQAGNQVQSLKVLKR
jgi:bacillolysin